jgi:endonuclease III
MITTRHQPDAPRASATETVALANPNAGLPRRPAAPLDRKARAAKILQILDELFPAPAIPLDHEDPFQLLVATILSAQCTDARVNLVTPALFTRAPDAKTMAKTKPKEILRYIRSCGLAPGKAKRLRAMSHALVTKHGGVVPRDFEALEELAGVGHKTASVVMAQAFGEPAFPVDTHIHRLAGRWQLSRARSVEETERDLKAMFPRDRWNALHLQIIYFGRSYCPALRHVRESCPICSWAMSNARALREVREQRRPKRTPASKRRNAKRTATRAPSKARASRLPQREVG